MTERPIDLESILDELLDAYPEKREQLLDEIAAERPEAALTLRRMLTFAVDDSRGPNTLGQLAPRLFGQMLNDADIERVGTVLGPYEIESLINRGGMGVVYRAQRVDGAYEQAVAVKFLPRLAQTAERRALFFQERANLARLEHPNIARIIDAGVTDDDHPYFIMEYVDGERIDAHCARLSPKNVLGVVSDLCEALAYCHRSFVVHGDIKPGNILVGDARVRLLDFGIGQWTKSDDDTPSTGFTEGFAAPEIERGEPTTTASDIYALGRLIERLLNSSRAKTYVEDLRQIVEKCTQADPADRYSSVESVKRDIEAVLDERPISLRVNEPGYVLRRFVSRNWITSAAVGAVVLSLAVGFSIALWQYQVATVEANRAKESALFVRSLFDRINPEDAGAQDISLRQVLDEAAQRIETEFSSAPDVRHDLMALIASGLHGLGEYERAVVFREKVLAYYEESRKQPNRETANAQGALATAYASTGNYDQSRALYESAIRQYESLGMDYSLELADLLGRYALAISVRRGDQAVSTEALQAIERKGEILAVAAPEDLYLKYIYLSNLANVTDNLGQFEKGAELKEEALRIAESNGYALQPTAIITLCNLGYSYQGLGRWQAAADMYEKCVERNAVRLGQDHPELIAAQQNLATVQIALGNFADAAAILEKTAASATRVLPSSSFNRLAVEINIARVNILVGQAEVALAELPGILQRMQTLTGGASPAVARVRSILGKAQFEVGELTQSRQSLDTAYATLEASDYWQRRGHFWSSDVVVWRAEVILAMGDVEFAGQLAQDGLSRRRAENNVQAWRTDEAQRIVDRVADQRTNE